MNTFKLSTTPQALPENELIFVGDWSKNNQFGIKGRTPNPLPIKRNKEIKKKKKKKKNHTTTINIYYPTTPRATSATTSHLLLVTQ